MTEQTLPGPRLRLAAQPAVPGARDPGAPGAPMLGTAVPDTAVPARPSRRDDWRLLLVMVAFVAAYAAVGARLGALALSSPSEPVALATGDVRPASRATVTDRHGRLMAANLPAWSLYVHPHEVRDPAATARALASVLDDVTPEQIEARIRASTRFAWIKRPVTPREKQAVMDLVPAEPAVRFGRRDMRVYPAGRMAAHVIGQVTTGDERVEGAELVGASGIELGFDAYLRDGATLDAPLALSLDLGVQAALTEVLARGIERTGALRGSAVLMDVRTGELVSLVSLPDFDPNAPVRTLAGGATNPRFNQAVKGVYELGSVFKTITAAIALEAGVATPDSAVETGTPLYYGRRRIRDMHRMPARMPLTDVVRRSSNVGSARLAMRVGTERFRAYLDRLGLLAPTAMRLPEARSARPLLPPRWTDLSTMTISFGHGLSISPVHLVGAYATLANGGRLVRPSLVKGGRPLGERVFSERTSAQMMTILRAVVERGTGRRTDVPGYEVGGKTGTADKPKPGGGYHRDKVLASFASVFPTSDPKYAMIILLDEPTDPETVRREASRTAVPVTAEAIARIAPLLGLRPAPEPEAVAGLLPGVDAIAVGLTAGLAEGLALGETSR